MGIDKNVMRSLFYNNQNYSLDFMFKRTNYKSVSPGLYEAMLGFSRYLANSNLERSLLDLVEIRASQLNGCAWCLDMHSKDAMESGESPQRIFLLNAWQESPQFTHREKMALKWTEAVTLISESHITDELFEEVSTEFTEVELVELTGAVISINSWNRANIAFQMIPGDYVSKRKKKASDED